MLGALYAFQNNIRSSPDPAASRTDPVFLGPRLLRALNGAFDKARQNEQYKVHKVLLNKLDDLATDLRAGTDDGGGPNVGAGGDACTPTHNAAAFARSLAQSAKDGAPGLAALWAGRAPRIEGRRRDVVSDGEDERATDVKSTDEEADGASAKPWSGRMQRKIESWTKCADLCSPCVTPLTCVAYTGRS
jgi:hypothetical protein